MMKEAVPAHAPGVAALAIPGNRRRPLFLQPSRAIFPAMEQALRTRITLKLNGENRDLAEGATVASLLEDLGLAARKVAVERNREIVPRSEYASTRLQDDDALEVVHFIGGG
jgi:thiamine biosynthesis protein ThiS